ncbi:helitron_like_N domain-containing protein [Trichonephila clavipes]|nr:helitron_like_N domain-containing protein [Trichonephila clavipes]
MMHVIKDVQVFGKVACFMYSIEWQKRGLPHMHLLVWLQTKICPDQVDSIINAEIPDKEEDPILYEVVTKNMIHGPFCNRNRKAPCIVDGKCSKRFPRQMLQETQTGDDGYPLYRRRKPDDGGHVVPGRATEFGMLEDVDNSWVVPYSPLLCRIFKAHINVEYCNSVKSIKYICKYVTKGSDAAMFAVANEMLNRLDEVTTYQQGRYISSSEAVWRLLNFPIHQRYPTVVHLAVHLEGGQRVYYEPGQPTAHLTDTPPKTTLTAFFDLCKTDPLAKTLLYSEVPRHFRWDASQKVWQIRKKGVPLADFPGYVTDNALGRVYTVHPNNREAFHMRLLLHHVRGPISFEHLKTVVVRDEDGDILEIKPCSTYTEACQVLGLVEDDSHWYQAMEEAAVSQSPAQLRNLFAILIAVCGLNKPITMWENHKGRHDRGLFCTRQDEIILQKILNTVMLSSIILFSS